MATAKELMNRSKRLIGALGRGETGTNAEDVDDLAALNAFMNSLWLNGDAVYDIQEQSLTVTTVSHTVGPTGNTVITRPITIESAVQRKNNIDYPIELLTEQQYRAITAKSVTSDIVSQAWYQPLMPDGKIFFFPTPSESITVLIRSRTQIEAFTINETVALPPGYEDMLAYNLALRLAPEYQREVPEMVRLTAATTLRNIKRLNYEPPTAYSSDGGRYSINSDTFGTR